MINCAEAEYLSEKATRSELLDKVITQAKEIERLKVLLKAQSDCLSGHMIGQNCHGPVLDESVAKEIQGILKAQTGEEV